MGCDIHAVLQGQWLKSDEPDHSCWHTVAQAFERRDYQLFGFLAGVRDETQAQPIARRGLPKDFCIRDECYHPLPRNFAFRDYGYPPDDVSPWEFYMGEHSFTWFTVEELELMRKQVPGGSEEEFEAVLRLAFLHKIRNPKYVAWRIVIGFDS